MCNCFSMCNIVPHFHTITINFPRTLFYTLHIINFLNDHHQLCNCLINSIYIHIETTYTCVLITFIHRLGIELSLGPEYTQTDLCSHLCPSPFILFLFIENVSYLLRCKQTSTVFTSFVIHKNTYTKFLKLRNRIRVFLFLFHRKLLHRC